MKIKNILFVLVVCLTVSACQEIGPSISIPKSDKIVVIEEFTGVRCVNCPQGSAEIDALLQTYPDNLIAISMHGGIFSNPYPESDEDFRTADGNSLIPYLNAPNTGPAGYPASVINRKWFNGQVDRAVFQGSWAGLIASEIQSQASARVTLARSYDETSRELKIQSEIYFNEAIAGDVNFTALITQDSIVDVQLDQTGKDPNYVHKHVLRDVITASHAGDLIGTDVQAEDLFNLNYSYTLPDGWDAKKCHVVVFVNRNNGSTLDIIQAAETYVQAN